MAYLDHGFQGKRRHLLPDLNLVPVSADTQSCCLYGQSIQAALTCTGTSSYYYQKKLTTHQYYRSFLFLFFYLVPPVGNPIQYSFK